MDIYIYIYIVESKLLERSINSNDTFVYNIAIRYISLNPKTKHIITLLQHLERAGMPQEVTSMRPNDKNMNLYIFFYNFFLFFYFFFSVFTHHTKSRDGFPDSQTLMILMVDNF